MKFRRILWLYAFMLHGIYGFSQPGGGGGIYISGIYDKNLKQINPGDSDLKIRFFALDTGTYKPISRELFPDETFQRGWAYYYKKTDSIFPPLYIPTSYEDGNFTGGIYKHTSECNQRVFIVWKGDSMLIDLKNIIPENGAGYVDILDSLIIRKGYYTAMRNKWTLRYSTYKTEIKQIRDFEMTAHGHLYKGEHIYRKSGNALSALREVEMAIKIGLDKQEDEEVESDLFKIYERLGRDDDALNEINLLIARNPSNMYYYMQRRDLYISMKRLNDALNDYSIIIGLDKYNNISRSEDKAMFKSIYLKNDTGAINDLKKIIDIPANSVFTANASAYSSTYFKLGLIENKIKNDSLAYCYWLKAMELLNPPGGTGYYINFFDSVITIHPGVAELYLSLAFAYEKECAYPEGQVITCYQFVIDNIHNANKLGLSNYYTHYYLALALLETKQYEKALKEINIAIYMDSMVPGAYYLRGQIQNDYFRFGKGPKVDFDQDYKTGRELNKTYVIKKW